MCAFCRWFERRSALHLAVDERDVEAARRHGLAVILRSEGAEGVARRARHEDAEVVVFRGETQFALALARHGTQALVLPCPAWAGTEMTFGDFVEWHEGARALLCFSPIGKGDKAPQALEAVAEIDLELFLADLDYGTRAARWWTLEDLLLMLRSVAVRHRPAALALQAAAA